MLIHCNPTITSSLIIFFPTTFFFISFFIKKCINKNNSKFNIKLPPGPTPLPIIGNLHQITSLPFRCFRDLSHRYGPIMHLKLGEVSTIVVSYPEIAKQMLKEDDPAFASRKRGVAVKIMRYNADLSFSPYGDYWKQMRKICTTELLSPKMVRSFRSIRRDEAARLIDSVHESSGTIMNLSEKIVSLSSSIASRAAFGGVCKDRGALVELMAETSRSAGGFEVVDYYPSLRIVGALSWTQLKLKMMRRRLDVILDRLINEHKQNRQQAKMGNENQLVDALLRLKEGGEELKFAFGDENIKGVLFGIFSAGTETLASTIDWTMTELMTNPNVMRKAQAEVREIVLKEGVATLGEDDVHKLKYLKLVIKETLRLHPPIPLVPRDSREACKLGGYDIPAKTNVMVNIWAMHRDPAFWNDPERFEPERFQNHAVDFVGGHDFHYLPFGSGRRMCPGITYALATLELGLAQLLYNFDWKLPEGVRPHDLDMIENVGITSSRNHNLFVVATPYQLSDLN